MSKILSVARTTEEKNVKNAEQTNEAQQKPQGDGYSVNPPVLPRGCRPLTHQVAGHRYGQGMLQHMDGSILKPVQPPPRGEREVNFYKKLFDTSCDDPVLITLRPFLPKLLGVWTPSSPVPAPEAMKIPPTYSYLKLEDACRRFRNPSILDIKIGRVSYDPEADDRKKRIESAKYPPLSDLGFQLLGMRISGPSPNEAVFYGKAYGWSLTKDKITEGLNLFLSGNLAWKKYIVKAFVQRLEMILSWFESQERYQFYSSSLLLIYEGEFVDGSSDSDEEFIHKYRQMQIPSMHADSYLATVRRFLNKNVEEGSNESNRSGMTSCAEPGTDDSPLIAEQPVSTNNGESEANSANTAEGNGTTQNHATPRQSTGHESGYSSEAESKLTSRRCSDNLQREFVTSLNRRIQESAHDYHKYRFPPDIVDVRMIDFAHVFEDRKSDENYIYGLRNLISNFRQILKSL